MEYFKLAFHGNSCGCGIVGEAIPLALVHVIE